MPEAFSDARARVGSLANVQDVKLVQVMLDTMVFELQDDDVETSDAISSDAFGVEAEVRVPPDGCAYNLVEFPAFFGAEEGRKTWDEAHQAYSGPFCAFGNSWTNTYLNAYDYINWGAAAFAPGPGTWLAGDLGTEIPQTHCYDGGRMDHHGNLIFLGALHTPLITITTVAERQRLHLHRACGW